MAPPLQKLLTLVVVLAIAVSLTAGAGARAMSGDMSGDMATAAEMADASAPTCDKGDCPDHSITGAPCDATCSGTLAVLSSITASRHWADQDLDPSGMPAHIGQTTPPDPSPPRFSVPS